MLLDFIQSILHDKNYQAISIDTRTLQPGDCYLAYKGDRFDGHSFIDSAIANGAAALIVDREIKTELPYLLVTDTNQALIDIAKIKRNHYAIPTIAVTGSCGKTTVKNMLTSVLSLDAKVLSTKGNQNNHIGVPLTLANLTAEDAYAVIEMGMNHLGEIDRLSNLVKPDVAIVNNIRPVHLHELKTLDNIAKAKAEIFNGLKAEGTGVIPLDDEFYPKLATRLAQNKAISFARDKTQADIYATDIAYNANASTSFSLHARGNNITINLNLLGDHNISNALACSAALIALAIPLDAIAKGLNLVQAANARLEPKVASNGALIIDDTYNSSPAAAFEAISVLGQFPAKYKVLVFGDMLDLGTDAQMYHRQVGEYAHKQGITHVYTVGELAKYCVVGFGDNGHHFDNKQDLITRLLAIDKEYTVLIKGSRGAAMETVVQALTANHMEKV